GTPPPACPGRGPSPPEAASSCAPGSSSYSGRRPRCARRPPTTGPPAPHQSGSPGGKSPAYRLLASLALLPLHVLPKFLALDLGQPAAAVASPPLFKVAGGGVVAVPAGVLLRPPPEGVGGDVPLRNLPADVPQGGLDVAPQLAQPLRRGQGLPGDSPGGLGHLQGQEAVALRPRRLHGGKHLRVVQHQAAAGELLVQLLS